MNMFEYLFEKRLVGSIGAKVVDDVKTFMIRVSLPPPPPPPPPPEEGKAVIVKVEAPSEFTPNEPFNVVVHMRNDGGQDMIFARLINRDTGSVIKEISASIGGGGGTWAWYTSVTLPQTTSFNGKVEAGHET